MGMIVQEKKQANVSQNLANIETPSFKQQELIASASHRMNVLNRANDPAGRRLSSIGSMYFGTSIDDLYTDYEQGVLEETSKPLDFAIEGEGFFTVLLPNGSQAYTRDGSFRLNQNGELVTRDGYPILDINGQTILLGTDDVTADANGVIQTPDNRYYSLRIVSFENMQQLQRMGDNLYVIEDGAPQAATGYSIKQGYIEASNVNPLEELVKLIEITRNFESNQKAIQAMDETLGKAVNEVGKL